MAAIFGCSPTTIRNRAIEYDLEVYVHNRKPEVKEIDEQRLKHLYVEKCLSCGDVARAMGVSRTIINARLKKLGIPIRPQSYYYQKWKERGGPTKYKQETRKILESV